MILTDVMYDVLVDTVERSMGTSLDDLSQKDLFLMGWQARCCCIESGTAYEQGISAQQQFCDYVRHYTLGQ